MPEKFLRVTMPDGSKWDVPARLIAEPRARYYAEIDAGAKSGDQFDRLYEHEMAYTLGDNSELIDWAENNMNWEDVSHAALRVSDPPDNDYQEGWCNGDKEIIER